MLKDGKIIMLIAGVDEAGRGCVIGPLVIAGVTVKSEKLKLLGELGVKDSKLLSPKKREALYPEIIKLTVNYHVIKVLPDIIDKAVLNTKRLWKLNRLEAITMAEVIQKLNPQEAYVDAADIIQDRFGNQIQECLTKKITVIAKHKADRIYPVVSAASIIAKVVRDQEIYKLKKEFGDFGSGYASDKKTIEFLKSVLNREHEYPSCVRKSWETAKRTKKEVFMPQKELF